MFSPRIRQMPHCVISRWLCISLLSSGKHRKWPIPGYQSKQVDWGTGTSIHIKNIENLCVEQVFENWPTDEMPWSKWQRDRFATDYSAWTRIFELGSCIYYKIFLPFFAKDLQESQLIHRWFEAGIELWVEHVDVEQNIWCIYTQWVVSDESMFDDCWLITRSLLKASRGRHVLTLPSRYQSRARECGCLSCYGSRPIILGRYLADQMVDVCANHIRCVSAWTYIHWSREVCPRSHDHVD